MVACTRAPSEAHEHVGERALGPADREAGAVPGLDSEVERAMHAQGMLIEVAALVGCERGSSAEGMPGEQVIREQTGETRRAGLGEVGVVVEHHARSRYSRRGVQALDSALHAQREERFVVQLHRFGERLGGEVDRALGTIERRTAPPSRESSNSESPSRHRVGWVTRMTRTSAS